MQRKIGDIRVAKAMDPQKKTICFIGQNKSTCDFIVWQLNQFLGAHVNVASWCLQARAKPPALDKADVLLASSHVTRDIAQRTVGDAREILVAERTVNIQNLGKLLHIQNGKRVLVVGSSEETAEAALNIIRNLGFGHLNMKPYCPGGDSRAVHDADLAVTMGLAHLVPEGITEIVDLGVRGIALSTFKRLMDLCRIPPQVLDELTFYYVDALMNLCQQQWHAAATNALLKGELEVILNTISEAIVAVNAENKVMACNPAAEKVLKLRPAEALGQDAAQIMPQVDLSGQGAGPEILKIAGKYYVVSANPFSGAAEERNGAVLTFRPVSEVQELDTKIRQELKRKGYVAKYTFDDLVGQSDELQRLIRLARKFAQTELTILLEGESGTGKEVLAQAIHNYSGRRNGPFVAINFAALTDNLAESELFGYIEGAFSGARTGGKKGLFEEAHQGTIFLDEIGDASLDVQKKILRVLEEGEVRRVGDNRITQVNVRVIAATNADLEHMVEQKRFRHDLFYRLYALPLALPPLRSLGHDVLLLFQWFAQKIYSRQIELEPPLVDFLTSYRWPGNIRELQNVVGYLSHILEPGEAATIKHLPGYLTRVDPKACPPPDPMVFSPDEAFARILAQFDHAFPLPLVLGILEELQDAARLDRSLGRQALLKRLGGTVPDLSESSVRRCMQALGTAGFLSAGTTRQGSTITRSGREFLHYARSLQ
jgi:transcriptional regulator with PAS, ATPase and Fis domain